jgi:hypothetical protein
MIEIGKIDSTYLDSTYLDSDFWIRRILQGEIEKANPK